MGEPTITRTVVKDPDHEPAEHGPRTPEPRSNIAWQAIVVRLAEQLADLELTGERLAYSLAHPEPAMPALESREAAEQRLRCDLRRTAELRHGLLYRLQAAETELASFEDDDQPRQAVVFDALPMAAMPRWLRPLAHAYLAVRRDAEWRRQVHGDA